MHKHLPTETEHGLLGGHHHLEPVVLAVTVLVTTKAKLQHVHADLPADKLARDQAPLQASLGCAADTDQQLLQGAGAICLQQLHHTAPTAGGGGN